MGPKAWPALLLLLLLFGLTRRWVEVSVTGTCQNVTSRPIPPPHQHSHYQSVSSTVGSPSFHPQNTASKVLLLSSVYSWEN